MLDDIQTRVFSRIKNKFPTSLKIKYPNASFTTSDRVQENPQFPNIYVHERASTETGEDLEGLSINAIISSFQIDVTDNESMNNAREIMTYIVSTMKSMRFKVVSMPEFTNTPDIYRLSATFRRVIGNNDVL